MNRFSTFSLNTKKFHFNPKLFFIWIFRTLSIWSIHKSIGKLNVKNLKIENCYWIIYRRCCCKVSFFWKIWSTNGISKVLLSELRWGGVIYFFLVASGISPTKKVVSGRFFLGFDSKNYWIKSKCKISLKYGIVPSATSINVACYLQSDFDSKISRENKYCLSKHSSIRPDILYLSNYTFIVNSSAVISKNSNKNLW